MKYLIYKEWILAIRKMFEVLLPIFFLLILITIFPIAVGPDAKLLAKLAPAIIWVGILLSILLSSEKLYKSDFEDGSLEQLYLSGHSKLGAIYIKLLVQWVLQILPIIAATPLLAVFYGISLDVFLILIFTLLITSPTLLLLAMLGSSITLAISRGSLILILIILPFYIPILIFAISAITDYVDGYKIIGQISILGLFLIGSLFIIPLAIQASIKVSLAES